MELSVLSNDTEKSDYVRWVISQTPPPLIDTFTKLSNEVDASIRDYHTWVNHIARLIENYRILSETDRSDPHCVAMMNFARPHYIRVTTVQKKYCTLIGASINFDILKFIEDPHYNQITTMKRKRDMPNDDSGDFDPDEF